MAPFEREGQLTQPRVRPVGIFSCLGKWLLEEHFAAQSGVRENVCCACPPATLTMSLSAPSPVISSQLAGPDAPDTVNAMLRFMAG